MLRAITLNPLTPLFRAPAAALRFSACGALALVLSAAAGAPPPPQETATAAPAVPKAELLRLDPRTWLPMDETLRFKVEVSLGPVQGLDVANVTLTCVQASEHEVRAEEGAAHKDESSQRMIASIEAIGHGGYLGRELHHLIAVRWFAGTNPRVEGLERLHGTRVSNRETRIGESDGRWELEYKKDRHCPGCSNPEHFVKGTFTWNKPSHCDGCTLPEHRLWREDKHIEVPPDALDILSALYYARGFLRSDAQSTSISLVNQDDIWTVHLKRGGTKKIETPAGEFKCVRVLLGPELAGGDGVSKKAGVRFEALFGLHGDISVWVDPVLGIPVMIEGTAPFGPFDLHIRASLTSHHGR